MRLEPRCDRLSLRPSRQRRPADAAAPDHRPNGSDAGGGTLRRHMASEILVEFERNAAQPVRGSSHACPVDEHLQSVDPDTNQRGFRCALHAVFSRWETDARLPAPVPPQTGNGGSSIDRHSYSNLDIVRSRLSGAAEIAVPAQILPLETIPAMPVAQIRGIYLPETLQRIISILGRGGRRLERFRRALLWLETHFHPRSPVYRDLSSPWIAHEQLTLVRSLGICFASHESQTSCLSPQ